MSEIGVGRDTSCTTGLRTGRFSSGARLVAEAAYRRLTTPRGTLRGGEDEANYGLDMTSMIGDVATKSGAASIAGRVKAELTKDARIVEVDVVVTRTTEGVGEAFVVDVSGTTTAGPFALSVAVSAVSAALLNIVAEGA